MQNLADRGAAYGIASAIVDGNDVVAVYKPPKTPWMNAAPAAARA